MKKVLSIIVSYNFEPWLTRCLTSLLTESSYPTDVMVIDNGSGDNTVSRISNEFPQVILHACKANLGFGQANNIGFEYAIANGYDAVFLVNQDAWIHPACIQELLRPTYGNQIGIISPMHYDGTGQQLDQGFVNYIRQSDQTKSFFFTTFVNAAFWLIPIAVLTDVGGFSPLFYHYGEDSDYGHRIHYHGYRFVVNTHAIAYHDRQHRKVLSDESFYHREYIYFLTEYANINYVFPRAFARAVLAAYKKAFFPAHPKRSSHLSSYLRVAWKVFLKTQVVWRTRRKNR